MSWFRKQGSFRLKRPAAILKNADPKTLLEAFREHCNQASSLMSRWDLTKNAQVKQDEVAAILNHLEQMINYIMEECASKSICTITGPPSSTSSVLSSASSSSSVPPMSVSSMTLPSSSYVISPILDYILDNCILERILDWSLQTAEFTLRLLEEQLRIFEVLASNCSQRLLYQKGFLGPLMKLLSICESDCPEELEYRLVALLNTLCVTLSQNSDLLQVFFVQDETPSFLVFSLLIPFVHKDGAVGQQARDAILLCMCLAAKSTTKMNDLGRYMANHSNFCPVLATGLSGLYSVLPRKLEVTAEDWYRLSEEDVQEVTELSAFLNSLEFCNAVTQVSHPLVRDQLLDFLLNGFLTPVMAPALYQSTLDEMVTTTAYLELFLRKISEPRLTRVFLHFLLTVNCDNKPLIEILVSRISAPSKLTLATISLFKTLLDFNCEEVMYELVFKYLLPCSHIMLSQRERIRDVDIYCVTATRLLALIPSYPCSSSAPSSASSVRTSQSYTEGLSSSSPSEQVNYLSYLMDARHGVRAARDACAVWSRNYDGTKNDGKNPPLNNGGPSVPGGSSNACNGNDLLRERLSEEREDSGIFVNEQKENFVADIGPFLTQVMSRLENMALNDVYTNLQLTSLISRLALYPQPLLRSFLLSQDIVFQPSVKSLYQILGSLKTKLDAACYQMSNFQTLHQQAKDFFRAREEYLQKNCNPHSSISNGNSLSHSSSVTATALTSSTQSARSGDTRSSNQSTDSSSLAQGPTRRRSFGTFFRRFSSLQPIADNTGYKYTVRTRGESEHSVNKERNEIIQVQMKVVLCCVVFEEFIKELAAISQEHTLLQLLDEVPND